MKKIILIVFTGFLTLFLFSCSDNEDLNLNESQGIELEAPVQATACCGNEGEILPPPPPPPN
jgi:ABC-type Fe3+-hydroxamate transport system substrate-binding protein